MAVDLDGIVAKLSNFTNGKGSIEIDRINVRLDKVIGKLDLTSFAIECLYEFQQTIDNTEDGTNISYRYSSSLLYLHTVLQRLRQHSISSVMQDINSVSIAVAKERDKSLTITDLKRTAEISIAIAVILVISIFVAFSNDVNKSAAIAIAVVVIATALSLSSDSSKSRLKKLYKELEITKSKYEETFISILTIIDKVDKNCTVINEWLSKKIEKYNGQVNNEIETRVKAKFKVRLRTLIKEIKTLNNLVKFGFKKSGIFSICLFRNKANGFEQVKTFKQFQSKYLLDSVATSERRENNNNDDLIHSVRKSISYQLGLSVSSLRLQECLSIAEKSNGNEKFTDDVCDDIRLKTLANVLKLHIGVFIFDAKTLAKKVQVFNTATHYHKTLSYPRECTVCIALVDKRYFALKYK